MTAQVEVTDQGMLPVDRNRQAVLIMKLFDLWELSNAERLNLLGLSPKSTAKLNGLKHGTSGIGSGQDAQDRVGYLLDIHKSLGLLFPQNPEMKYGWVKMSNGMLENRTPLEVMLSGHMLGIIQVCGLLNFLRGR